MTDNNTRTQHIITASPDVEKLMSLGTTVFVKKDTVFMKAEEPSEYCYIVKEGKVVSTETFSNGKTRNGLIMTEGSMIGEPFVLLGEKCPTNFLAMEDCQLVRINRDTLINYLNDNPHYYKIIVDSISKKLLSTMNEVRQMAGCNVTWRICNLLLVFAHHYGVNFNGKICINTNISQQDIAHLLYVNRITVVRVFKRMQSEGLIERIGKMYYITDMNAFMTFMEKAAYSDNI
ncbi:MAG: Crp/Fnr family transcriptional regulator [Oscillospiraceae bacterium]|nr:Crp/Fnr family transcriptional regulator [Oscillospiraceae bacterium]